MSRKIQSAFYDFIIWLIVHFIAQQMVRVYIPIHSQALFYNLYLIYNHSYKLQ